MRRALAAAAALLLAVVMVMFAPAAVAREPLPVVPDGCVWTGGGLACGVGSAINDPAEPAPEPVVVEVTGPEQPAEPAPVPVPEPVPAPVTPAPVEPAPDPPTPDVPPSCG